MKGVTITQAEAKHFQEIWNAAPTCAAAAALLHINPATCRQTARRLRESDWELKSFPSGQPRRPTPPKEKTDAN